MGPIKFPVTELFVFACIGLLASIGIGGWVAYHLARAILLYVGVL